MRTQKQIENSLISHLGGLIDEYRTGSLQEEDILYFFMRSMQVSQVDSEITVNVLENIKFGKLGKEVALTLKIDEGW